MGPVGLVWLVVSVGLGAFLGAFFLCEFGLSWYFYSLITAKGLFALLYLSI